MKAVLSNRIVRSLCFVVLMLAVAVKAGWSATVAVYGLTSPRAVEPMVAAKKRGVDVRLITDLKRTEDVKQLTALHTLQLAGIPIRVNQHDGLMHLKQVVIDDEVNVSGSMNHTTSGNRYNDERLDVITDSAITAKAREKFLAMWNDHDRYREWK